LIILLADHQTSGGYPRLGTVIKADLPLLAQAKPKDKIYLEPCSMTEAEGAYFDIETKLEILRTSVSKQKTLGDFS
jgi:antagonist of KipI